MKIPRPREKRLRRAASYLQDATHPLEAVFLGGVRPLLGHHHDPLVPQDGHGEHGYPATAAAKPLLDFVSAVGIRPLVKSSLASSSM